MQIALQLKAAQSNAERQIQALDRVADGLRPSQVQRWVERVLDDRDQHLDRIGRRYQRQTNGTLKLTFATSPQRVLELTTKFAQALTGGEDASTLRAQLLSSFRFSGEAGRILFDSTVPVENAGPEQKLAMCRHEMAECRKRFLSRHLAPRLLKERCRILQRQGEKLLSGLDEGHGFADELASFQRFRAMLARVAAA